MVTPKKTRTQLEAQVDLGKQAKARREDPLYQQAFDALAKQYANAWALTKPEQSDLRESLYAKLRVLEDVHSELLQISWDGESAALELAPILSAERAGN